MLTHIIMHRITSSILLSTLLSLWVARLGTAFNIQVSSLQDLLSTQSSHLSFVGSFQAVFPESADCTDACIYTSNSGDASCAQHERFYPIQISVSPAVWSWESAEIPAGEYNAMIATDALCWEAVGTESDLGVMEPVPFTVPSYGSTVQMTYFEDTQRVTVSVFPLVEQFSCDGKPYFVPNWENYGGAFKQDDDDTIFPVYEGYVLPENSGLSSTPSQMACDFPQMLVAEYNVSIIATMNVPDFDELLGAGHTDPLIRVTLPDADPFGEWKTEPFSDCENCTIPHTFAGRTIQLGAKVGGSRMEIELWDGDIGFEWLDDFIGAVNTSLMRCSFADVRTDAVCGNFDSATDCMAWKPSQYNNNPNFWDETSCQWINERCRGCEAYESEQTCQNANCHWRGDTCTDICSQDVWLSFDDEPCAEYNMTLDEWTFNPNASCVKVRQEAMPFTATIESLLFEAGDLKIASAGRIDSANMADADCEYTADELSQLASLDCDALLDGLEFDVVKRAHPLCIPCQSSLDFVWQRRQGYAYVADFTSEIDVDNGDLFLLAAGAVVIQQPQTYFLTDQGTVVYARKVTSPKWMSFRISMDARVWFFRAAGNDLSLDGGDMEMVPTWVEEGITTNGKAVLESGEPVPLGLDGGYEFTPSLAMSLEDANSASTEYYAAFYRDFSAGDVITLGGSAYGVTPEEYFDQACVDDGDNFTSSACAAADAGEQFALANQEFPLKMYISMVRPLVDVVDNLDCDVTIDILSLVVTICVFVIPATLYTLMVWWFLDKQLDYNFDMIPAYIARQVLTGPDRNILGSIPATYKSGTRGDVDNVWFRRHVYYATQAIQIVCWSPIVVWSSFGASVTSHSRNLGMCVLFLGNAMLLGGCATLAWRRRQWRMTAGIRHLFMGAAAMVILYLVLMSIFDVCGASFFSLTTAFLTLNMVIMSQVNFAACPHVSAAYFEIEKHSQSHEAVMADIMSSLEETQDGAGKDTGNKKPTTNKHEGLTSYISDCYSVSSEYPVFKFSNAFIRDVKSVMSTKRTGAMLSIGMLAAYCIITHFILPNDDITALGISITVVLLDSAVYMLRNGMMSWSPSYITVLMLLSRIALVAFNSEFWIVGHAAAYTVFGIAVSREIVDQKMPRMTGLDAGAVAYFSRGDNVHSEQRRRNERLRNVAGSPVFVAGFLLLALALTVVLAIFTYGDSTPSLTVFGIDFQAVAVAVAMVIINILVLLVLATSRALYLQSNSLLQTNKYFCVKTVSMATLLAVLFVAYTILTGILLTALTGSTVWIQVCVFVPLIVVSGGYSAQQYFKNDCSFSLNPRQRAKDIALWRQRLADEKEAAEEEERNQGDEPDIHSSKSAGAGVLGPLFSTTNSKKPGQTPSLPIRMPDQIKQHTEHLKAGAHLKQKGANKSADDRNEDHDEPVVLPPIVREEDQEGYNPNAQQKCCKVFQLFWDGRLAPREYFTFFALTSFILLSLLFCVSLAFFLRPWYIGAMVALVGGTLVFGLLPLYEYSTTWQFNCGMVFSLLMSFACLGGFSAIVFLILYEASFSSTGNVVLVSLLFWWPEFLLVGFTLQHWREKDFVMTTFVQCSMIWLSICLVLFAGVVLFWVQNVYVFVAYLYVVGLGIYAYILLQWWLRNDRFLPRAAIYTTAVVVLVIVGVSIAAIFVLQADLLFCLSICFITVSIALVGRFLGAKSGASNDGPLGYNSSVFPVYMYDSMHHDVFDQSDKVWGIFQMFFMLLLWGGTCAVYFVPVDVGIGLIAVVVVCFQLVLSYFSTKTIVDLGQALRCVDELILKTAAMKADEKYQTRRSKFVVAVPQDLEPAQQKLVNSYGALELYANIDGATAKKEKGTPDAEGLEQTGVNLNAAQVRAKHLDTMHLKSAEYYGRRIFALQNNLRYLDSEKVLGEPDWDEADEQSASAKSTCEIVVFGILMLFTVACAQYLFYFVVGYFYDYSVTENYGLLGEFIFLVACGACYGLFQGITIRKRSHRPDGLFDDAAARQEILRTGAGPYGFVCCCGILDKVHRLIAGSCRRSSNGTMAKSNRLFSGYAPVSNEDMPDVVRHYQGMKVTAKIREAARAKIKARAENGAENLVETLKLMPTLHKCLDYQYREEMRAFAHFVLLVIQAANENLAREGIRFQQFLREYRFKLLANNITPPRRIFTSKSYATIDVNLVASWLSSLTVEQKKCFDQLKATFIQDITHQINNQIDEDEEEQEQAADLAQERAAQEYKMNCIRYEMFLKRREQRERENRTLPLDADEVVANAEEQLEEIARTGESCQPGTHGRKHQFVDPDFPHTAQALGDCQGAQHVVGWKAASDINETAALFKDGSDPDDVFQGELFNQWLLSALSMVAASGGVDDGAIDPLIDQIFINKDTTTGAYAIKLWVNSQWETVIVDDFFPVRDDKFKTERSAGVAFAHSHNMSELWVPIYEKAVAKYYGSYATLERGFVHQALTLITGAPTECLYLANASNGSGKTLLWRKLLRAHENKYILGAASITGDTTHKEILESGIMMNAAYLIYDVVQIDSYQLIKLRNPPDYGEGAPEWQGDWSDNSPLWTKRLRKKLGMVEDEDDHQFWMSFDDFCIIFRCVYVCKAINHRHWKNNKIQSRWSLEDKTAAGLPSPLNPECDITRLPQYSIAVHRPTDVLIKLSQTENGYATLQDPPFHMAVYLCKLENKKHVVDCLTNMSLVTHSGDPMSAYELTLTANLLPGKYAVVCALFQRGSEGPFELDITSRHSVEVARIDPDFKSKEELRKEAIAKVRSKIDTELDKIAHVTGENQMDFVDYDHSKPAEKPFNWVKILDPNSKQHYYYDVVTHVSSWEAPEDWDDAKGRKRREEWEREKEKAKADKKAKKAAARKAAREAEVAAAIAQ